MPKASLRHGLDPSTRLSAALMSQAFRSSSWLNPTGAITCVCLGIFIVSTRYSLNSLSYSTNSATGPQGPEKITALLKQAGNRIKSLSLDESSTLRSPTATVFDAEGKVHTVQAFLSVQTDVGSGDGIVRLIQEQGKWKVFTLFTYLKELEGHGERTGRNRPNGVEHGEHASQQNWLDRRKAEEKFEGDIEPTVIIMG